MSLPSRSCALLRTLIRQSSLDPLPRRSNTNTGVSAPLGQTQLSLQSPRRSFSTVMVAQAASASVSAPGTPPHHIETNGIPGNSSGLSLPDSPTSILAGTKSNPRGSKSAPASPKPYEAPPIPRSWRESLSAWLKTSDSAAPELHLYRHTGYFDGAVLNNARNADLATAFADASALKQSKGQASSTDAGAASSGLGTAHQHLRNVLSKQDGEHVGSRAAPDAILELGRATVGTSLASDGKVGSIRTIDIGSPAPKGFASWFTSRVPRLINMLEVGTPRPDFEIKADANEEKVVLLHGYGAGTAFFYQNIKALAQHPKSRLYALDWLGMGRSSRVPFNITSKQAKNTETRVEAAETFFIQALEDWRKAMGVGKMTLVGHSLGGYLSMAYTLKYPQNVSRLVLVSPAGIPANPEAESDSVRSQKSLEPPSSRQSTEANGDGEQPAPEITAEIQQPQKETAPQSEAQSKLDAREMARTTSRASLKRSAPSSAGSTDEEGSSSTVPKPPRISKRRRDLAVFLWEQNLSPFAILRGSLMFGPMLAGSYTSRRFGRLPDADLRALHAYCYAVFTSRGSSEYCLGHLLAPFGYARMPMVDRVGALPKDVPVTFIYGARDIDWMDIDGGEEAVRRLRAAGNLASSCFSVPNSGHHVYLDNPRAFNKLLRRVLAGETDK